jgi:hypothetical protein
VAKKKQAPESGADRKARVEALRKQQKAEERKKTIVFGGIALVIVVILIGIPTLSILNKHKEKSRAYDQLGVPVGLASCDPTINDKVGADDGNHETDPTVKINYDTAPPSHGRHYQSPITVNTRGFYTTDDAPRVEELVHNEEHGYTIVWYTAGVTGSQLDDLKTIASKMRDDNATQKFIVVPWDTSRGAFPTGKSVAITHWGAPKTEGKYATATAYRQYCGQVSGSAIKAFVDAHPETDAPEPNTP